MQEPNQSTEHCYSYGETPIEIIRAKLEGLSKPYSMQLVGEDAELVQRLVNIGIDSHLEACFCEESGDSFEWVEHKLSNGKVFMVKLHCAVSPASMLVLLRRMLEDGSDEAMCLRTSILSTLDIEEV